MNGQGGGMFSTIGGYVRDPGFWISVVIVSVVVSFALQAVGLAGRR